MGIFRGRGGRWHQDPDKWVFTLHIIRKTALRVALQKDLPRFSRISIQSKTASLAAGSDLTTVVRTLASVLLQNDEVALSNVESALRVFTEATSKSSLAQGHKAMDQQEACSELLESLGGDGSRLVRALKLVNQNVVLFALTSLRTNGSTCL